MLDDSDDEWLDVDWEGLEEAALRQKQKTQAIPTQASDPDIVCCSLAAGSQHSLQPPTPSAFTLVQHPHPKAPLFGGSPSCAAAGKQIPAQHRAFGNHTAPAIQSADLSLQAPAVVPHDMHMSQRNCEPGPVAPHMLAYSSAPGAPYSQIRYAPGCLSIDRTGDPPQSCESSNPLPHMGTNSSQQNSWSNAASELAERRLSGASAGCSGREQQRISSPLWPLTNGSRPSRGGSLSSPMCIQQPQQAGANSLPRASVSGPAQIPNRPSAAQMQHEGSARQEAPRLQRPAQGRGDKGGLNSRRNLFEQPLGSSVAVGGAQCMTLADVHRRVFEFLELLPHLPMPPSSHAKCPGVFKVAHEAGCGAEMVPWRKTFPGAAPGAPDVAVEFWGCARWPECDFRDVLPKRLAAPQIALEAAPSVGFKVMAALGAEQVIQHCGGLRCLLGAVGVNLSMALPDTASVHEDGRKPAVLFAWEHHEMVVAALKARDRHGLELIGKASLIPQIVVSAHKGRYEKASDEEVTARFSSMAPMLERALLPFQREGVRFALRRGGRALIADEMGVGKTVQAIALASCYQEEWPLLVVAPASLRLVWAEELARWLPHLRACAVHVIEGRTDRLHGGATPQVVVTSYEMLANLTCKACCAGGPAISKANKCAGADHCMAARGFKVVIVDESHALRTTDRAPDSRNTEAAVATIKAASRAVLLSGTPSLSRPYDLFRQVDALRPGLLGVNREVFANRYCNRRLIPVFGRSGTQRMKWSNTGLAHAAELHALLKQEVMLRRLKREVMAQLPPKRRQVVRLPPPLKQHWPPDSRPQTASGGGGSDDEDDGNNDVDADVDADTDAPAGQSAAMSVGQRTGLAKLPNVLEWLRHALGSGGHSSASQATRDAQPKFLVFAHHKSVMAQLAAALEGEGGNADWGGAEYVRIEGGTDHRDRREACTRFRDDPAVRVALLSVTAAGTGLDFSAANAVVFAELPDEVALVRQAEDRAHRHGQRFPVNVYFLLARGTSDERRWQNLNRSLERVSAVHDGDGDGGAAASAAAEAAPAGDSAGIALDAVRDVGGGLGWGCTQALPQQSSSQPDTPDAPVPEAANAVESATAASTVQQEEILLILDENKKEEVDLVPDSDDDEDWGAPMRGQAPLPSQTAPVGQPLLKELPLPRSRGSATGDCSTKLDQAAAPSNATEQQDTGIASNAVATETAINDDRPKVWFEVSRHTNRVHFHGKADGSRMLGLSLPMDLLTVPHEQGTPQTILDLRAAVDDREGGKPVVGQAGLLALGPGVDAGELKRWIREAREFAAEWGELRAVHQNHLAGNPLRCPLLDALAELDADAKASGAYGLSTDRQLDTSRPHLPPPPGAELATVHVRYVGRANTVAYKQAFTVGGGRLCIYCMKPVELSTAPPNAVLEGAVDLFCGVPCEAAYALRSGGSGLRRALFKIERGRCQLCHLDCHKLITRLRVIEKGTRNWMARRQARLAQLAPKFSGRGFTAAAKKLVSQCLEGNAWHADHIRPVYKGGGLCHLENLRTLCVPCHQEVTKRQASERAAERKLHKQHTLHAFLANAPLAASGKSTSTGDGSVVASAPGARPRRQLKRIYSPDEAADADFRSLPHTKAGPKKRR